MRVLGWRGRLRLQPGLRFGLCDSGSDVHLWWLVVEIREELRLSYLARPKKPLAVVRVRDAVALLCRAPLQIATIGLHGLC